MQTLVTVQFQILHEVELAADLLAVEKSELHSLFVCGGGERKKMSVKNQNDSSNNNNNKPTSNFVNTPNSCKGLGTVNIENLSA